MDLLLAFLLLGVGWIVYYLHHITRHLATIEKLLDTSIQDTASQR